MINLAGERRRLCCITYVCTLSQEKANYFYGNEEGTRDFVHVAVEAVEGMHWASFRPRY